MKLKTTRRSRALLLLTAWMALGCAVHVARADDAHDKGAIRGLINKTWDKPDAKVVVGPIVIDDEHAVAGWTLGERGGRALLKKRDAVWAVVLCSGDPLKATPALIDAGVPEASAERLAADLAKAEAQADPQRVKLFSTFEGVVHLEAATTDAHHSHHDQNAHDLQP